MGLEVGYNPLADGTTLTVLEPEGIDDTLAVVVNIVYVVSEYSIVRNDVEHRQDVFVLFD